MKKGNTNIEKTYKRNFIADRVNRGGSWDGSAWLVRVLNRNDDAPSLRYNDLGFRLVLQTKDKNK